MGVMRMKSFFNDKQLHAALNRLRGKGQVELSDEYRVRKWMEQSLRNMRLKSDELQGPLLQWNQGACQILQELIDSFNDAKATLTKN